MLFLSCCTSEQVHFDVSAACIQPDVAVTCASAQYRVLQALIHLMLCEHILFCLRVKTWLIWCL